MLMVTMKVKNQKNNYQIFSKNLLDPRDYRRGGYHPVRLGELFNRRSDNFALFFIFFPIKFSYLVLRKLGWGQFSTVWMCSDAGTTIETERYVALKIVKSHRDFTEVIEKRKKYLKIIFL